MVINFLYLSKKSFVGTPGTPHPAPVAGGVLGVIVFAATPAIPWYWGDFLVA